MNLNKDQFIVKNEKGEDVKCTILATFDSHETKKSYVVYTDDSKDKDGNFNILASIYTPDKEETKLENIETEREWEIVEAVVNQIKGELENEDK